MGELQQLQQKRLEILNELRTNTSAEDQVRLRADMLTVEAAIRQLGGPARESNWSVRDYVNAQGGGRKVTG
jgi:hypothetical protein